MKRIFLIVFILAAAVFPAAAQSPAKILSKAAKELGGEKALKAATPIIKKGSITRLSDGAVGSYEFKADGGGRFLERFDIADSEMERACNGRSCWMRDAVNGTRTVTGDAGRDMAAEAVYRNSLWLNYKKDRSKILPAGNNAFALTTSKGTRIVMRFAPSGMLIGEEIPFGDELTTYTFDDHRTVNGVKLPFRIEMARGGERYRIQLDSIQIGKSIDASSFDFPKVSGEPLPDIPALLQEVRANADRVNDLLDNYSYTELRIDRGIDDSGALVEKGSEKRFLTFYKGYRINRLIEKNGKPLSASDQADEDRDVQKQVGEIEKRIAANEKRIGSGAVGQPNGEGQRITISDALKGSELVDPRRERFKGRDVIVFGYRPDPAFKPKTRNEKLFALCTGTVWVDTVTKQVVRLEAVLTGSAGNFIAKAKRGASFTLDNELVNDEIWLPSRADIDLSIKILFAGININYLIKYGDYRKFSTEVTDSKVGSEPVNNKP